MSVLAAFVSALLLPGFAPYGAHTAGGGQVLEGTFPGTMRTGYVYLPPQFSTSTRYPVVYLLHGMPGSPSEYLDGTDLATFADQAIETGAVRPFIAVLPAAGARRGYNGEWAGPWEDAVVDRIVPWIDAQLPTRAEPAGRVIAGLSAGGFGAIDIALRHPGVFGAAASWSGYFSPLHDGPFRQATSSVLAAHDPTLIVRAHAKTLRLDRTRFFISSGPSHSHWFKEQASTDFARELRSLRLPVVLHLYPSARGEWRAQLDAGLEWAFGA